MRLVSSRIGDPVVAGVGLSIVSGLGAAVLFHRWCVGQWASRARLAVLLLLLYPFAFYLMGGGVQPTPSSCSPPGGLPGPGGRATGARRSAGALASATRPVGVAVILGLWVLALERRGVLRKAAYRPIGAAAEQLAPDRRRWAAARPRRPDLGYCLFLGIRFHRPLAFLDTAGVRGWDQPPGFHTWFKVHWRQGHVARALDHRPFRSSVHQRSWPR